MIAIALPNFIHTVMRICSIFLRAAAACVALAGASLQALEQVDFSQFVVQNHPTGSGFDLPLWSISLDGSNASETKNSYSTFLVSPTNIIDKTIRGFITPSTDDDLIGMAIGYQAGDHANASANYLLITWKGASQSFDFLGGADAASGGGNCPVGLAISRVNGVPNHDEIWQRANLAGTTGGVTPLARAATLGSTAYNRSGGSHYFKIEYTASAVRVWVDGVLQFDIDGTFVPARFCMWEMSQSPGATFAQFSVAELDEPEPGSVTLPDLGATPNPPATVSAENPYGMRAYVWENVDATTNRAGAGELLRRAGFHVIPMPLNEPPWAPGSLPETDVDLIFIGSYVSDSPAYAAYMNQHGAALDDFIDRGGVIVQMAQRDSIENRPPFLPSTQDTSRGTTNFASARVLHGANPIMANVPVTGNAVAYEQPAGDTNVIFNAFDSFAGFDVVLSGDIAARSPALMEGSYGQGRFFLAQMTFDKIIDATSGLEVAPASLQAFNAPFFDNLYEHCKNVRDGTIDEILVTPPPGDSALVDGAWSIVLLPDTQIYSQNYPGVFFSQTSWIADNIRKRNIRFVIGLGDITNVNSIPEWKVARSAAEMMHGRVPYVLATGNHDYGPSGNASTRDTKVNEYLPYSRYAEMPTFGGSMTPNNTENTYHLFEAGGVKWIIISLEWAPRDSTITWADGIVQQYPDRKAILVTHAYMNNNDLRYDITDTANPQDYNPHRYSTPGPVNDGQQLWDKLVKKRNFAMTLNGHVLGDGTGFRIDNNNDGNPVAQMLINYQFRALGGEGYLRILEFQPDGHTVKVISYSPIYNRFIPGADQQFSFDLPLNPPDTDNDGIFDYYDDSFDDDADGLSNYTEYVLYGTHTGKKDTDGDGVNDNVEVGRGTNPLTNDGRAMNLVLSSPQNFGLYNEANIRELSLGDLIIGREGNGFTLDLQLQGKESLEAGTWQPLGDPVQWSIPLPDSSTYFLRVRTQE